MINLIEVTTFIGFLIQIGAVISDSKKSFKKIKIEIFYFVEFL